MSKGILCINTKWLDLGKKWTYSSTFRNETSIAVEHGTTLAGVCVSVCLSPCLCVSMLGKEEFGNRGNVWCLQSLTQGLPLKIPMTTLPSILCFPQVLNSASPGYTDGAAVRLPGQILLSLLSSFLWGPRSSCFSLLSWPAILLRKVTTPALRSMRNQWSLSVSALGPAIPRMSILVGWEPHQQTVTRGLLQTPSHDRFVPPYAGVNCCVALTLLMPERRKTKPDIQCQCKGLTAT